MNEEPLTILFLAVLLDLLIGDPCWSWHPVALIGRLIAAWERLLHPRVSGCGAKPAGANPASGHRKETVDAVESMEGAATGRPAGATMKEAATGRPAGATTEGAATGRPRPLCGHPAVPEATATGRPAGVLPADAGNRLGLRLRGAVLVLGTVLPVWLPVYLCLAWLRQHMGGLAPGAAAHGYPLWSYIYVVVSALFLWSTISIRSLDRAAREILGLLRRGDLATARRRLSLIVGRDTERLGAAEITRATVETVAESISDGVIAPLFYFLLGGAPLACAYRAVNTLDSMVGYRSERYRDFGMAAARLDDVANFLPARLTALLLVGSALLLGLDWRQAWRIAWRDGARHPSPNSGYTEAAVAGALGVQLGGLNYYQGQPSLRPRLGEPATALEPGHIAGAIRMLYGAVAIFLFLAAVGWAFFFRC